MPKALSKAINYLIIDEATRCERFVTYEGKLTKARKLSNVLIPWHTLVVNVNPRFCDEKTPHSENPHLDVMKLITEELNLQILGHKIDASKMSNKVDSSKVSNVKCVKLFFPDEESIIAARDAISLGRMDDYLLTTGYTVADIFYRIMERSAALARTNEARERDATTYYSMANFGKARFAPLSDMPRAAQSAWKESTGNRFLECFTMEFCCLLNNVKETNEKFHAIRDFWKESDLSLESEKNRFFYNIYRGCELQKLRNIDGPGTAELVLKMGVDPETLQEDVGIIVEASVPHSKVQLTIPLKHVPFADKRIVELGKRLCHYVSLTYDSNSKVIYDVNVQRDYSGRVNLDIQQGYWNNEGPNPEETKTNLLAVLVDEDNSFDLNWVQVRSFSTKNNPNSGNLKRKSFKRPEKAKKTSVDLIWSRDMTDLSVDNVLTDAIIELANLTENSSLLLLKYLSPYKKRSSETNGNYLTYECVLALSRRCKQIIMSRRLYDYYAVEKPQNFHPLPNNMETYALNMAHMIKYANENFENEEVTIFYDANDVGAKLDKLEKFSFAQRVVYLVSDTWPLEKNCRIFEKISDCNLFVPTKIIPINLKFDSVELNHLILFEKKTFSDIRKLGNIPSENVEWLTKLEKHEKNVKSGEFRVENCDEGGNVGVGGDDPPKKPKQPFSAIRKKYQLLKKEHRTNKKRVGWEKRKKKLPPADIRDFPILTSRQPIAEGNIHGARYNDYGDYNNHQGYDSYGRYGYGYEEYGYGYDGYGYDYRNPYGDQYYAPRANVNYGMQRFPGKYAHNYNGNGMPMRGRGDMYGIRRGGFRGQNGRGRYG